MTTHETTDETDRTIDLAGVANARDLGGIPVTGGRVRAGRLFRTAALDRIDDPAALTGLGVTTVFDLRTDGEIAQRPDRLPDGVALVQVDVLGDAHGSAAAQLDQLAGMSIDAGTRDRMLAEGSKRLRDSYRDIVMLDSARAAYASMFSRLAAAPTGAAVFHCAAGKDRTGWAAAALLVLLGAGSDDVYADYLASNAGYAPIRDKMLQAAARKGLPAELLAPLLGVRPDYLDYALEIVEGEFGGVEGYFTRALGLTDDQLSALRLRFVDA